MSAATTDLFMKLGGASSLVNTPKTTATRAAAGATLTVDNCNWDQTTGKIFATYQVDTSGNVVSNTEIIWKGIVTSSTTIGSLTRVAGAADSGNAIGDYVELLPASAWGNNVVTGILTQHNQDGTHGVVTATSLNATGGITDGSATLQTVRSEQTFDYIASGCVLSGTGYGTTLNWSLTSGVVYIGGKRLTVASATGTVTASKDTYFDLLDPGSGTVATLVNTAGNIVSNNAASPALAASSVRLGIIVSGAGSIAAATSVNQGQETMLLPIASSIPYAVTESLGNLICPRDPNRRILGYRQITTGVTGVTSTTGSQVTGLTVPFIVPTGRKVKATAWVRGLYSSTATAQNSLQIWDGTVGSGTNLATQFTTPPAISTPIGMTTSALTTPAATSKTYNVGIATNNASNAANLDAATTAPAYLLIELV